MKNMMKAVCAVTMVGGCAVDPGEGEATQAATQTTVFHSTYNGSAADVWTGDSLGGFGISVWQTGRASDRTSFLWYSSFRYREDFSGYEYEYAWGPISNDDVALGERESALHTSDLSGLYAERCTVDFAALAFSCAPFTPTSANVSWHADGFFTAMWNGAGTSKYGLYSYRSQGMYKQISAQVEGDVFGHSLTGAMGSLSDSRGTTVNKDVLR